MIRESFRSLMKSVNRVDYTFEEIQKLLGEQGKVGWLFYILEDGQAHTQKQLAEEWMIPKSTLNDAVKKAKEQGLVELTPVPKTRRELEVRLTAEGEAAAKELLAPYYQLENQALEDTLKMYSEEFVQAFDYFSKRLKENIIEEVAKNKK